MAFFGSILHAYQRLPMANLVRAGYWLAFAVLTIRAAQAGWGLLGLAAAMAVSAVFGCISFLVLVRRALPWLRIRQPQSVYLRKALSYSIFMFLISAGTAVVFETDTLVIAAFRGAAAVTAYAVALRLTRGLTLFLHKAPDVLFPFYAGMSASGQLARIGEILLFTARLELAGGAAVILGLAFAGRPLIGAWVGPGNVTSVGVFALAIALVLMEVIIHPAAILAAAAGGERRMAAFSNAEAVLNLGFSIVLVTRFGVVGVIAGTVAGQCLTNLWFLPRWAMQRLQLPLIDYLEATAGRALLPAVCGLAGGMILLPTHLPFIAAGLSILVFALVYWRTGAGAEERRWVNELLSRERPAA